MLQLVLAERLVVLFARSGIGKTSLINAGLTQSLRDNGFFPMVIRVNGMDGDPLDSLYRGVRAACERGLTRHEIDELEPADRAEWDTTSLWHFFESFYIWRADDLLRPVVIIDQFEELFTLVSDEPRRSFIDELADLVRGTRPRASHARSGGAVLGERPPDVRVVLSIREDYMAHLEELAGRLPSIWKARLRLAPLNADQARRAIVEPAALPGAELATPPFEWSEEALQSTLDFLRTRKSRAGLAELAEDVEPFQLQLVCQAVETVVRRKGLARVTLEDIGGVDALREVLTRFYRESIDALCRAFPSLTLRRRLEALCEHGLITDKGTRRLCEESEIRKSYGISREVLAEMVELRLIRKEPRIGDDYYELTHDTLIRPIMESRTLKERKRRHMFQAGAAVALIAALGTGVVMYNLNAKLGAASTELVYTKQDLAATEANYNNIRDVFSGKSKLLEAANKRLRAGLVKLGHEWGDRGSDDLALAFYDAADSVYNEPAGPMAFRVEQRIGLADLLAQATYIEQALDRYADVMRAHGPEAIPAISWYRPCWFGGIFKNPEDVLAACEYAVAGVGDQWRGAMHDSRGVVRARTGNVEGAVADFIEYIDWARGERTEEQIDKRAQWIEALREGEPFDPYLEELRDEVSRFVERAARTLEPKRERLDPEDARVSLGVLLYAWSLHAPAVRDRLREGSDSVCEADTEEAIERCDELWASGRLPGMDRIRDNDCSAELRKLAGSLDVLLEVFVTDARGYVACMSQDTTDYYQADEVWWRMAEARSPLGVGLADEGWRRVADEERLGGITGTEYDESADSEALSVPAAIRDREPTSEQLLGVVKAVFAAEILEQRLEIAAP